MKFFAWDDAKNAKLRAHRLDILEHPHPDRYPSPRVQKKALAEGLPYQTLTASLLHESSSGRLEEV